jgi:hypothetical protein
MYVCVHCYITQEHYCGKLRGSTSASIVTSSAASEQHYTLVDDTQTTNSNSSDKSSGSSSRKELLSITFNNTYNPDEEGPRAIQVCTTLYTCSYIYAVMLCAIY